MIIVIGKTNLVKANSSTTAEATDDLDVIISTRESQAYGIHNYKY